MPLLRRVIGAVLRKVRLGQGRTLRQVAAEAGVSLPYLSEVERGTKEASSEVLAAICRALRLTMPDLLDEVRREMLLAAQPAGRSQFRTALAVQRGQGPRVSISRTMVCARTVATVRL
ncbi:Helix-turn-helix domain-containing protein [Actinoplanes derwentensis]|uniref:Helix-turn-helix domain-containing protein n=1 Tax=Actinoplanes derwentensis TaxID=113562 RepID=A0A1H2AG44_9ACTN|nr:transcriptional regulator [Actinoplanes derwentensis]SDT44722.1 Helix-turn-helix domain-containing protein [Actinoplanes derwentensis]